MGFKRYTSIDNCSRKLTINYYNLRGYLEKEWVVTTKIHGANFSFVVNEDTIQCCNRSGPLKGEGSFFSHKKVLERYKDRLYSLRKIVLNHLDLNSDCSIQLFGEIFGGHYPHPDVKSVSGVSKVQKGVWYCPDVDFCPFDIYVEKEDDKRFPVDHDVFEELISKAGFALYAKAIFKGTFEQCLDYPNEYSDPIHKHYGLPEIEDNICEGNVLKPVKAICDPTGSRVLLKNKNEKFTERDKVPKEKREVKLLPEVAKVVQIYDEYVTENRLRNVISHIGEITNKDFGKLMKEFTQDIREDALKDCPDLLDGIEKSSIRDVNKVLNKYCSSLIKSNFVNIIDGEF